METENITRLTALQLVGSPTSRFYFELSVLYARPVVRPEGFDLLFLIVYPDGRWSLNKQLTETDTEAEDRMTLAEMLAALPKIDLVVPHLFCPAGLTAYRSFFEEVLSYPLVGSPGRVLDIAQSKQLTRLVAQTAGVQIAPGILVKSIDRPTINRIVAELELPVIVKPDKTDNSDGLALVRQKDDLRSALTAAAAYGVSVIVERYIPGREIRGAVIEIEGKLIVLPFIEYQVSKRFPIRMAEDKLRTDDDGSIAGQSLKERIPATCPAEVSEALTTVLGDRMKAMHRALGCRDFSLFDFRVDETTGEAYLLEAGLFWSFGEVSMISGMLVAGGFDLASVTQLIWRAAAQRV